MIIIPLIFFPSLFLLMIVIYLQGFRDGHRQGWRNNEKYTGIARYDLTK